MSFNVMMQKLYKMDKMLGGNKKDGANSKNADAFLAAKEEVLASIHALRTKQKERNDVIEKFGRNVDALKITAQIKNKLPELEKQLDKMNTAIRAQRKDPKKYSQAEMETKEKVYTSCIAMFKDISNFEKADITVPPKDVENQNVPTINDLQQKLLTNTSRSEGKNNTERDLTPEEAAALERFKKKDEEMDNIISQINDGLYVMKDKAQLIGTNIDRQAVAMDNLNQEIDTATAQLESSNARLKKVLEKFRSPSKLCLDISLILFLIGLGTVILNLVKGDI